MTYFFSGRPALYVAKKIGYGCVNLSFAPYGEYWREVRKFVILELLGPKRVQMFQFVRDEEVGVMIDSIAHKCYGIVNLSEVTVILANNVLCRCAFGNKYDGEGEIGMGRSH
ncbi:putative cytochrome P450 [Rosa chinensis]|uniref:Putative cytochrome P450 n=1 Tax=Rosa chinensis TaxID=74649 RepID=A0A2P6S5P3_ROSCH|nr:putative cytochrome P450 [Rosa chinensis]